MPTPIVAIGGVVALILASTGMYLAQDRIEICHQTASDTQPWNTITVSVKSWENKHQMHGDKYPVPAGGCDAVEEPPTGPTPPGSEF